MNCVSSFSIKIKANMKQLQIPKILGHYWNH